MRFFYFCSSSCFRKPRYNLCKTPSTGLPHASLLPPIEHYPYHVSAALVPMCCHWLLCPRVAVYLRAVCVVKVLRPKNARAKRRNAPPRSPVNRLNQKRRNTLRWNRNEKSARLPSRISRFLPKVSNRWTASGTNRLWWGTVQRRRIRWTRETLFSRRVLTLTWRRICLSW